ncbi:MAG: hypothetical protein RIE73_11750 [Coleofasciculus sp. C1-SOL-03]
MNSTEHYERQGVVCANGCIWGKDIAVDRSRWRWTGQGRQGLENTGAERHNRLQ